MDPLCGVNNSWEFKSGLLEVSPLSCWFWREMSLEINMNRRDELLALVKGRKCTEFVELVKLHVSK